MTFFWISWKHSAEERVPNLHHTNQVIGAYVTSGARRHPYRYLDRLGERPNYCDTDSVIYIQPKDEPNLIVTGDKLGDMTFELRTRVHYRICERWTKEQCIQGN